MVLKQDWIKEFTRFCLIGVICTLIDWVVFYLVKSQIHQETQSLKQIVKALSFIISASLSYYLNRTWTFASNEKKVLAQASKFFFVALIGLGLNNLFFYLVTGILRWTDLAGLILSTGLVLFWNFSANKFWVFRQIS